MDRKLLYVACIARPQSQYTCALLSARQLHECTFAVRRRTGPYEINGV